MAQPLTPLPSSRERVRPTHFEWDNHHREQLMGGVPQIHQVSFSLFTPDLGPRRAEVIDQILAVYHTRHRYRDGKRTKVYQLAQELNLKAELNDDNPRYPRVTLSKVYPDRHRKFRVVIAKHASHFTSASKKGRGLKFNFSVYPRMFRTTAEVRRQSGFSIAQMIDATTTDSDANYLTSHLSFLRGLSDQILKTELLMPQLLTFKIDTISQVLQGENISAAHGKVFTAWKDGRLHEQGELVSRDLMALRAGVSRATATRAYEHFHERGLDLKIQYPAYVMIGYDRLSAMMTLDDRKRLIRAAVVRTPLNARDIEKDISRILRVAADRSYGLMPIMEQLAQALDKTFDPRQLAEVEELPPPTAEPLKINQPIQLPLIAPPVKGQRRSGYFSGRALC